MELMDSFEHHGSIQFTMHNTDASEFLVCDEKTPKEDLARAMKDDWRLEKPGLLVRVTGAVDYSNAEVVESLQAVLEGVVYAVSAAHGYLFSTGLGFGMASLVGSTIARERHRCQAPLIGVASWSSVQGREQLSGVVKGAKFKYRDTRPDSDNSTISLEPVHTHFVLVKGAGDKSLPTDSPDEKLFKARVHSFTFAHALEQAVAEGSGSTAGNAELTPRLLVVLNGDSTTLSEVEKYAGAGNGRIVLAAATGGLAAALAKYLLSAPAPARPPLTPEWEPHRKAFEALRMMDEAQAIFTITDSKSRQSILEVMCDAAIVQATNTAMRVRFAVEWNDPKRLEVELAAMPSWLEERGTVMLDALQLALELQHGPCVTVCFENAANVKGLNLLKIYDALFDEMDPPLMFLFKGCAKPTERLARFMNAKGNSAVEVDTDADGLLDSPLYRFYPVEVLDLLNEVVPDLVIYWQTKMPSADAATLMKREVASEPGSYARLGDSEHDKALNDIGTASATIGPRWLDVFVWAVLLGNTELALTVLPCCREPMRAAVIGKRLCSYMASKLPLHALTLAEAGRQHEEWAIGLLDLADSFEEAQRMLVTKSKTWRKALLHLAVQSDLRALSSHVHCQTLCEEWLSGNDDFDSPSVVLNGRDISIVRIFFFMLLPVNWPGLRPMLAWRVPPAMEVEVVKLGAPSRWAFYSIPQVKFIVRFTMHMIYTLAISFATMETPMSWVSQLELKTPEANISSELQSFGHVGGGLESYQMDACLWLWTLALCFDELYKYVQFPSTFQADFWNRYDYLTFGVVQISLFLRFLSIQGSVEGMCFAVVLVWCRLFKFLQLDYNLGVLVIILMKMVKDIAMWLVLSSICLIAFTVSFVAITNPYVLEETGNHPITAPLWAMLGSYDLPEIRDWNPNIGKPMMWLYLVVSNVVLVNLLIAMMGNTFGEVYADSDREWKFGRLRSVIETTERFHRVPPPFNLPFTMYTLIKYFYCKVFDPVAAARWVTNGADQVPIDADALKEAKKAKLKVARKLLWALKRKSEDDAGISLGGVAKDVSTGLEQQKTMNSTVLALMQRMERYEKAAGISIDRPMFSNRTRGISA